MSDKNFDRLLTVLIAAKKRRTAVCEAYDALENGVLRQMQERNVKAIERDGFTIHRVAIPVTACRSCGHELPTDPNMAQTIEKHAPERLKIQRKVSAADAA